MPGDAIESTITQYSNFEQLKAAGQSQSESNLRSIIQTAEAIGPRAFGWTNWRRA